MSTKTSKSFKLILNKLMSNVLETRHYNCFGVCYKKEYYEIRDDYVEVDP